MNCSINQLTEEFLFSSLRTFKKKVLVIIFRDEYKGSLISEGCHVYRNARNPRNW
jgi:hypothetical protein